MCVPVVGLLLMEGKIRSGGNHFLNSKIGDNLQCGNVQLLFVVYLYKN